MQNICKTKLEETKNQKKEKQETQIINKNIETIEKDLEELLKIIREYCKEDIIIIGIYINTNDETINNIIKTANDNFKRISKNYNIKYIDQYEILKSNEYIYPNKQDHEIIGNTVIEEINNNLLKK